MDWIFNLKSDFCVLCEIKKAFLLFLVHIFGTFDHFQWFCNAHVVKLCHRTLKIIENGKNSALNPKN